jgi:hypothetical protein
MARLLLIELQLHLAPRPGSRAGSVDLLGARRRAGKARSNRLSPGWTAACTRQKQKSPGLAIAYNSPNFTKSLKYAKHEFGSC